MDKEVGEGSLDMSADSFGTFFLHGGTFAVLRPCPYGKSGEISLRARVELKRVRDRATLDQRPNFVIVAPRDVGACVVAGDRRWPRPVFVPELDLPALSTCKGGLLSEGRVHLGNVALQRYLTDRAVGQIMLEWAQVAATAVGRAMRIRLITAGRVVICGSDPMVGLLASFLVPRDGASQRHWAGNVCAAPVESGYGFTVSRTPRGVIEVKSLPLTPPPIPQNVFALRRR